MQKFLHRSRLGVTAAVLALGLGASTAVAQAAPSSTALSSATTAATAATAVSSLPCGFSFWHQSYRNCSRTYVVRLSATAHESQTNRTVTYYYCLKPGTARQPLAVWGMLVYNVYARATLSC